MVSSPKPPDPYATAKAQRDENWMTAAYNAVIGNANQVNPFGTLTNTITGQVPIKGANGEVIGYAPQYTQTTKLSPQQQELLDIETLAKKTGGQTAQQLLASMGQMWSKPMDTSGLRPWSNIPSWSPQQFSQDRRRVETALNQRYNEIAAPQEAQARNLAQLQGASPGSPGYGSVEQTIGQNRQRAANEAVIAGGAEQSRQWGDLLQGAAAGDAQRGQQYQELLSKYTTPAQLWAALTTGSQPTVPQFQGWNAPSTSPTNIAGLINDNYAIQAQAAANKNAGLFGIAGNLLSLPFAFA